MRLEPHDTEPGLWVNPAWQEGTPGTFAVIIGVSYYAHLDGGEAPAAETFGLDQLQVSALTAYQIFRWLAEQYWVDGCPLARCWLLLSPTAAERQHTPDMTTHLTPPTFDNCQQALRFWRLHMEQLPRAAAESSRALFFFSGHGLEVHQEQQVLLPSDYLRPPSPSWNDAISTDNLKKGLASLAVPHQLFFLDACRNDHDALRSKRVTGADILSEDEAARVNALRIAPLLYATASGQQAFQQPQPQRGISLFGRALLDGLTGQPYIELAWQGNLGAVKLYSLQEYLKERVVQLLADAGARVIQPVKLSGIVDNELITYLERSAVPPWPAREPELPPVRGISPGGVSLAPQGACRIELAMQSLFTCSRDIAPAIGRDAWRRDFSIGHDLFGSEEVTALWSERITLFALGRQRWLDPSALVLHKVERDAETNSYRAVLSVTQDDPAGYWLQLVDTFGTAYACVLPTDQSRQPRYALEVDFWRDHTDRHRFSRLEASLAFDNPGPLDVAAELWQRYRMADVGAAVSAFEMSVLERMVHEKLDSPLAATVATLILLRANRLDLLRDWVRNLANWFESRPDGPALWAEQLMRQPADSQHRQEVADYLTDLLQRGLPYTSEAISYAARLIGMLRRLSDALPLQRQQSLARLNEVLQEALVYFRPGGLFATYAGFPLDAEPPALIGPFDVSGAATRE